MSNKILVVLLLCLAALTSPASQAQTKNGTKDEAKALAEKAAAIVKENSQDAFAKFQAKDGGFIDHDLYVFVLDSKGLFAAHGTKPALIGKNGSDMKDTNGFEFVKAFLAVKDTGWVDYRWPDPTDNNKPKDKSTYIIRVGDYVVGVGFYK